VTIAAPTALYVNGIDLAQYGFVLESPLDGFFDFPERRDTAIELPQGHGHVLAAVPGAIRPRPVTLGGVVTATTRSELETRKDAIKVLCSGGQVELRLVSRDVVLRARLQSIGYTHFAPQLRDGRNAARVTLRFVCADPFAWDRLPQVTGFLSSPVALNLGTGPSRGRESWSAIITIMGAATTPTLTEYDAGGNVLRTMAFTFSPTASDAIEIDVGRGLVTRIQSGTRDNGYPYLTAGFAFPRLEPAEGNYLTSAFPRLAVSSGVGIARYYRSWL
jgi:hypothetical protein